MTDGKLIVEINNTRPVELFDLTQSLGAFASEYRAYADIELDGPYREETKLYVREMRTGSIITELIPYAPLLLPMLSEINTVIGFAKHLVHVVENLREPKAKGVLPRSTLENLSSIVEPIAKDSGSQMNITAETVNVAPVFLNVNFTDANALQNQARKFLEADRAPTYGHHEKVLMYWFQARNDPSSRAGDRAIIESISPRPIKVVFASDKLKYEMLRVEENLFSYAFVVDVDVETVNGKPALYRVTAIYDRIERAETG